MVARLHDPCGLGATDTLTRRLRQPCGDVVQCFLCALDLGVEVADRLLCRLEVQPVLRLRAPGAQVLRLLAQVVQFLAGVGEVSFATGTPRSLLLADQPVGLTPVSGDAGIDVLEVLLEAVDLSAWHWH